MMIYSVYIVFKAAPVFCAMGQSRDKRLSTGEQKLALTKAHGGCTDDNWRAAGGSFPWNPARTTHVWGASNRIELYYTTIWVTTSQWITPSNDDESRKIFYTFILSEYSSRNATICRHFKILCTHLRYHSPPYSRNHEPGFRIRDVQRNWHMQVQQKVKSRFLRD